MIGQVVGMPGALGLFGLLLVIYGFAPGMLLALILRLLDQDDPRRRELHAELYAVPRWDRPFWVMQQFEVALREGFFPDVAWWWNKAFWHHAKLESGLERHLAHPKSFEVPNDDDKEYLCPGDLVKLMWSVKRMPGERMWVRVTNREGDRLTGTLENWACFVFMNPGEPVKFHVDDIIDCIFEDEGADGTAAA